MPRRVSICHFCNKSLSNNQIKKHLMTEHNKTLQDNYAKECGFKDYSDFLKSPESICPVCKKGVLGFYMGTVRKYCSLRCLSQAKLESGTQNFLHQNLKYDADGKSLNHKKSHQTAVIRGTHHLLHKNLLLDDDGKSVIHKNSAVSALKNGTHPFSAANIKKDSRGKSMNHVKIAKGLHKRSVQLGYRRGYVSKMEMQIYEKLVSIYQDLVVSFQINEKGHRYDFYIPSLNIIIEVGSFRYHPLPFKEKDQLYNKLAVENGYRVFWLYEETFTENTLQELIDSDWNIKSNLSHGYLCLEKDRQCSCIQHISRPSVISHNSNVHSVFPPSEDTRVILQTKMGDHFLLRRKDDQLCDSNIVYRIDGHNFRASDEVKLSDGTMKLVQNLVEADEFDQDWLNDMIKQDQERTGNINWKFADICYSQNK